MRVRNYNRIDGVAGGIPPATDDNGPATDQSVIEENPKHIGLIARIIETSPGLVRKNGMLTHGLMMMEMKSMSIIEMQNMLEFHQHLVIIGHIRSGKVQSHIRCLKHFKKPCLRSKFLI